jgi:hypothetical protein
MKKEAVSNTSCEKVKISRLLKVFCLLLLLHSPIKLRECVRCGHGNLNYNTCNSEGRPLGYIFTLTFLLMSRNQPVKYGML